MCHGAKDCKVKSPRAKGPLVMGPRSKCPRAKDQLPTQSKIHTLKENLLKLVNQQHPEVRGGNSAKQMRLRSRRIHLGNKLRDDRPRPDL